MDNYSYAESGDSSPRSRDQLEQFENSLSPWDDHHHQQLPPNFRVKFMCSYGGRINPRLHDNQLLYVGGDTKILAVERAIKFHAFLARISSLCDGYASFKYQLPGEDLDSLISVTNDDDLEHMMQEYDRMYKASSKPARLRLFLFQEGNSTSAPDCFSDGGDVRSERQRFIDALNTAPTTTTTTTTQPPPLNNTSQDRLFNLEKGTPVVAATIHHSQITEQGGGGGGEPVVSPSGPDLIQRQIQDFQRLHLASQPQPKYEKKTDVDNVIPGDYYAGSPIPTSLNLQTAPLPPPPPAGYWPESQVAAAAGEQSVYMIPTAQSGSGMYHGPMIRQVTTSPGSQGGFYLHRINPSGVYGWDQASNNYDVVSSSTVPPPAIGVSSPISIPTNIQQQQQGPTATRMAATAYNSEGRGYVPMMTYYSASPGGIMLPPQSPYQPVTAASDQMRMGSGLNEESGRSVV